MFFDQKLRDKSKTIKVNRQRLQASIRAERLRAHRLNMSITTLLQKEDFGSAKEVNNNRIRAENRAESLSKVELDLKCLQNAIGLSIQKYTDVYNRHSDGYSKIFNPKELEELAISEASIVLAKEVLNERI